MNLDVFMELSCSRPGDHKWQSSSSGLSGGFVTEPMALALQHAAIVWLGGVHRGLLMSYRYSTDVTVAWKNGR